MLNKVFSFGIAYICLSTSSNSDACEITSLQLEPTSVQPSYDVFDFGPDNMVHSFTVKAQVYGQECSYNVALQLKDFSKSLKNRTQKTITFDWFGANGYELANQWRFTLTDVQPSALVQMRFPSKQWLDSGDYIGALEAFVISSTTQSRINELTSSIPLTVNVKPAAKIQFYGITQQHYDLDLGELYSNKIINSSPNLWVQSNSAYIISIQSSNRGTLKHQSGDSRWNIPYELIFGSRPVDLQQVAASIESYIASSGFPIPLKFIIGDTYNKPGGKYTDTIQISIEPTLSEQAK